MWVQHKAAKPLKKKKKKKMTTAMLHKIQALTICRKLHYVGTVHVKIKNTLFFTDYSLGSKSDGSCI